MKEVEVRFPPKVLPGLFENWRYKVMKGGRGSAKSHTAAGYAIIKASGERHRIQCFREIQRTLAQSSKALIEDTIDAMRLNDYFIATRDRIRHKKTLSEFGFSGLQDHTAESIKSLEGITIALVDEAHQVSHRSWNILIPTIRAPGSEFIITFNPDQEDDYVYERFVKRKDPDAWVCDLNYSDNPWFPQVLETERLKLKAINDDLYQHVWEGKCRSKAGLLFKRRWFKKYDNLPSKLQYYMAGDYAGARDLDSDREPDFNELGIVGLDQSGDWYVIDWWAEQVEDPDEMIQAGARLAKKYKPLVWFEEKGPILRSIDPIMRRRLREIGSRVFRKPLASASSKAERALGFAAVCSTGRVHFPNTPWAERVINQLCAFTGEEGRHDDAVDVCSLLARGLDSMSNARVPVEDDQDKFTPGSYAALDAYNAREKQKQARYYR